MERDKKRFGNIVTITPERQIDWNSWNPAERHPTILVKTGVVPNLDKSQRYYITTDGVPVDLFPAIIEAPGCRNFVIIDRPDITTLDQIASVTKGLKNEKTRIITLACLLV